MPYDDARVLKLLAEHEGNRDVLIRKLLSDVRTQSPLIEYLLWEGITRVLHRDRRDTRGRIKAEELFETGIREVGPSIPRYEFPTAKRKIRERTLNILATWMIGDTPLGDMTKTGLIKEADHEILAGNGHHARARFYYGLAEPLDDTKTVKEYWRDEGVRLLKQSILDEIANQSQRRTPTQLHAPTEATI